MQLPADPSRGEAEGVVKDAAADKEIAGKLELLKGGLGFVLSGERLDDCMPMPQGLTGFGTPCDAACKAPLRLPPIASAGISFFACPGELTALMGGSGAWSVVVRADRMPARAGCACI